MLLSRKSIAPTVDRLEQLEPPIPAVDPSIPTPAPDKREVRYRCSEQFIPILRHLNASVMVSTYQAGKVATLSARDDQLDLSFANFEQAMGMAVSPGQIAVGSRRQIWFLEAAHEFAGRLGPQDRSTACYLARKAHVTGNIHVHDMAWSGSDLWIVNTLFSCLCTLDDRYNFVPRWRPPFISALAAEDRCHLNGLAMEDGQPKFVTALAQTDEPGGWRPNKAASGCILDVASGETVVAGLAMPHSPRIHAGKLWVLNSGQGELSQVDPSGGRLETVERVPGYTRGLSFGGQFAFVGMSRIRETNAFGGLPISEQQGGLRCGVAVVDLQSGKSVAWFEFLSGVEEIFDVQALPGRGPVALRGPHLREDEQNEVWIIPPIPAAPQDAALE